MEGALKYLVVPVTFAHDSRYTADSLWVGLGKAPQGLFCHFIIMTPPGETNSQHGSPCRQFPLQHGVRAGTAATAINVRCQGGLVITTRRSHHGSEMSLDGRWTTNVNCRTTWPCDRPATRHVPPSGLGPQTLEQLIAAHPLVVSSLSGSNDGP